MTNKEILAELKQSYEYMRDIRDNGCNDICNGQLGKEDRSNLFLIMEKLAETYDNLRRTLDDDECRVVINNCDYYIGNNISEDYTELYDDENNYTYWVTCEDINYFWYQDYNFINN